MAAYVVYQGEVTDPQRYVEYKTRAAASIAEAGGRYLVRAATLKCSKVILRRIAPISTIRPS